MPTDAGEELYARLEPMYIYEGRNVDEENGFALRTLCYALGEMFAQSELLGRDTDDYVGYSILLDIDRIPVYGIRYLAQYIGEADHIPPTATGEEAREIVRRHLNWQRGTQKAIISAAQATLTGTQTVRIIPRDTSAYKLTIITRTSETPDPAKTEAAIRAQLPAGIILSYLIIDGETYNETVASYDAAGVATYESTLTTFI